ncbi:MAG: hypothetical protein VZQ51_07275 [Bacteroidales bacterium]|nr:hypothetical protein [Bacteroidales bacterium]
MKNSAIKLSINYLNDGIVVVNRLLLFHSTKILNTLPGASFQVFNASADWLGLMMRLMNFSTGAFIL